MICGYIRVSTDKQTTENQRFEILKFSHEKKLSVDRWIEETISATKKLSDRKLGTLIERMREEDILIVTELSRLGRFLLEVTAVLLHDGWVREMHAIARLDPAIHEPVPVVG